VGAIIDAYMYRLVNSSSQERGPGFIVGVLGKAPKPLSRIGVWAKPPENFCNMTLKIFIVLCINSL